MIFIVFDYFARLHRSGCLPEACRQLELPDIFPFRWKAGRLRITVYSLLFFNCLTDTATESLHNYIQPVQLHSLCFHFAWGFVKSFPASFNSYGFLLLSSFNLKWNLKTSHGFASRSFNTKNCVKPKQAWLNLFSVSAKKFQPGQVSYEETCSGLMSSHLPPPELELDH